MIQTIKKIFGIKEKVKTILLLPENAIIEKVVKTGKVIPFFDKEQEYRDLHEDHNRFFSKERTPAQLMQSQIGEDTFANIEDVTPSRSQVFFQNAPSYLVTKEGSNIEEIEKYMNIPITKEEPILIENN